MMHIVHKIEDEIEILIFHSKGISTYLDAYKYNEHNSYYYSNIIVNRRNKRTI